MKDMKRDKEPAPIEATETIRREILAAIEQGPLSARDISGTVGISEKDVAGHLEHIRASLHRAGRALAVHPAECLRCGFLFEKRSRLTTPGRCPVCRSESVQPPLFSASLARRS